MRTLGCLFAGALSAAAPLLAQDTAATGHAAGAFFLTNAGVYVGAPSARAVVDWGVMVPAGRQAAIGASFFAIGDYDGFAGGPAIRYRHWLGPQASLDVAVGVSIVASTSNNNPKTGSLYGLVKWSPVRWFGIAARPEVLQRIASCGPFGCTYGSQAQLSVGVEFGGTPGLVLSVPGALVIAAAGALSGLD